MSTIAPPKARRDRGAVLPLVLIVVVVMSLVIVALADYASTTLRFGQGVERSGDRLAAADAALDNTLEAIDRTASLCALTPLVNTSDGYTFDLGHEINGIEPTITCRSIGSSPVTGVEEFALVLTSDADQPAVQLGDALLNFVNGGTGTQRKVIDGPVYFARPPNPNSSIDSINVSDPLTIRDGDIWYTTDTDCIGPDPDVLIPSNLMVGTGFADRCLETDWDVLFDAAQPPEPSIASFPFAPPPDTTGICHVWEPGEYISPPMLAPGSYNYFRSGDYYFSFDDPDDGKNVWNIGNAWVLVGKPGPGGPPIGSHLATPPPDPHPCQSAWLADTSSPGATIYLGGRARMEVLVDGALTITGRDQGGGRRVAVQAFETQNASTLLTDTPRLIKATANHTDPDRGSKIAIEGLVWAPFNSLELGRVANRATPALSGGAVIGELHLGARPDRVNRLVAAGTTPAERVIRITATATSPEGGTTSVEAVIAYRDGDYGLVSRRVRCLTPEANDC